MELRDIVTICATSTLAFVGWYYGYKFLQLKNYLLGLEWWVIGFSASNMFIYLALNIEFSGLMAMLCDAFSRSIGIPVIAWFGLMKVINGYEPSRLVAKLLFLVGAILAVLIIFFPAMHRVAPYLLLSATLAYCLFAFWLSWVVVRKKHFLLGILFTVSTALSVWIAIIYDFFPIENDAVNVFYNFYTVAQLVWAASFLLTYYVYTALLHENRSYNSVVAEAAG